MAVYEYVHVDQINRVRINYEMFAECPAAWFEARVMDLRTGEAVSGNCDEYEAIFGEVDE